MYTKYTVAEGGHTRMEMWRAGAKDKGTLQEVVDRVYYRVWEQYGCRPSIMRVTPTMTKVVVAGGSEVVWVVTAEECKGTPLVG